MSNFNDQTCSKEQKNGRYKDAVRGCIYGGAVGDALGYPVEFLSEASIVSRFGPYGITGFKKDTQSGKALISDDTQMSLFTANGLLFGDTNNALNGIRRDLREYVAMAYRDWLFTQEYVIQKVNHGICLTKDDVVSWLLDVPEMLSIRSPGSTSLTALKKEQDGERYGDYVKAKRNDSRGCGGIMRVAPLAVFCHADTQEQDIEKLDMEGAQLAAITHGHPLGYMPAAVLVHIINRIVFPPDGKKLSLKEIVLEARDTAKRIFAGESHLDELTDIIDRAVLLSEDIATNDLDGIHQLGAGWVAEETLGISLYCALKYQNDFSSGVIAAVNHNGDSDSTGAVTGNILGALHGYDAIEEKWKTDLEISDVILEIADDLCSGCPVLRSGELCPTDWETKYVSMRQVRKRHKVQSV